MKTLCDKYKPLCFLDIKGQDTAIQKINFFMTNFPKKKALILSGPAGTGKTSLAYALALETKSEILELNASDLRNEEQIKKIIGSASQQASLFSNQEKQSFSGPKKSWDFRGNKILLIDEIDGITKDDRGGLPELIELIQKSSFPMIITANNVWDRKFSELRKFSEILQLKEVHYNIILGILKNISEKEKFNFPEELLKIIAIKSKGDVRAAINDLQTVSIETRQEDIYERDKEVDIFLAIKNILQNLPNHETLTLYDKVNLSLDDIFLWLEENIPTEYSGEELVKAYEALSKADVFRGRIHRQQHWRFLIYQNFLLSAGISSAKEKNKIGFKIYKRPSRILKIWLINQKHKFKKSISEKYARHCHISKKRAMRDFPIIRQIINKPGIQKELRLEQDEVEFLSS